MKRGNPAVQVKFFPNLSNERFFIRVYSWIKDPELLEKKKIREPD
jgi:hypothetical protein